MYGIQTSKSNSAEYTNLAPGKYTFWVTGSNNTGTWNAEDSSIFFCVHPPRNNSQAALFAYLGFILLMINVYLRFKTTKYRRDQMPLEKQVSGRTGELRRKNEQIVKMERLKMAASLIEKGEGTITEILMNVGFSNPFYFARCFKEQFASQILHSASGI